MADTSIGGASPKDGAKILATGGNKPTAGEAAKAASIVSLVTGEEILDAIVNKSKDSDAGTPVGSGANGKTSALKFARQEMVL